MKKSVTLWNCKVPDRIIDRPEIIGTILVDKLFTREDVFNLCNWSHYTTEKPDELLNIDINTAGSGLLIFMDNKYHLSLSTGWFEAEAMNNELEHSIYLLQHNAFYDTKSQII